MELQTVNKQLASTTTNIELIKQIYHVNYLTNYPINDLMIEGWAKSIEELEPKITPEVIKWIIDNAKIGVIDWDNRKGIQNIFSGFVKYIAYKIRISENRLEREDWQSLYYKYKQNKIVESGLL